VSVNARISSLSAGCNCCSAPVRTLNLCQQWETVCCIFTAKRVRAVVLVAGKPVALVDTKYCPSGLHDLTWRNTVLGIYRCTCFSIVRTHRSVLQQHSVTGSDNIRRCSSLLLGQIIFCLESWSPFEYFFVHFLTHVGKKKSELVWFKFHVPKKWKFCPPDNYCFLRTKVTALQSSVTATVRLL
jgi:hypothetical protein